MITETGIEARKLRAPPPARWQQEMAQAIREPWELLEILALSDTALARRITPTSTFPMRVPRSYVRRMHPGDPHDPLLRQVLPLQQEAQHGIAYSTDPVGDLQALAQPGLLHKYQGRALLIATAACAVHCRYCFRRHFPYSADETGLRDWQPALQHLAANPTIREIILSGGDPLSLSDQRLAALVRRLEDIPHLRRLRIHSRLPVVLPTRVDEALADWLGATRLQTIIVIHANHPNEIDAEVAAALARLQATGATLLNQSVLLRGVNDDSPTLTGLSEQLFAAGVLPYYLHLLDKVQGAAHFDVSEQQALELQQAMLRQLPGYLVPRLVREQAGAPYKIPLSPLAGG